jgi:hypothetical protein
MFEDVSKNVEDLSPEDVAGLAGVESEFGKYDKPLTGGSARGTFQLMPNTIRYLKERLEKQGSEPEANPLREEARLAGELMKQHESELGENIEPTIDNLYVKHNLGGGAGKKFLKAKSSVPTEEFLSEEVIESNPSIYKDKTKGEAFKEIQRRLKEKRSQFKFEDRSPLGFLKEE